VYILSLGLGSLVARVAPSGLLLPVFFVGIACIVMLTVLAHKIKTPPQWGAGKRLALVALAPLLGPTGTETEQGVAPKLLLMALLFMFGFVFALALQSVSAA
jgi:hypothetical protein